ncbi:ectoine hydroxylase [Marinimicrobium sp. ARAG 43.8]|uniref:ectoine hydroxylase n=1 Tax=Marinimicrobium sp. ARAG 43.8 TaxID=3418719 RepID=UPI003CF2CA3A
MLPDLYPTRLEQQMPMFDRKDPIVYDAGKDAAPGPLAQHHLERFKRDGFLWFENLFSQHPLMTDLMDDLVEMGKDRSIVGSERTVTDQNDGSIRSIFGIHELSQPFARLTTSQLIVDMVRQLLGSDVYIHQSRINAKPGFVGGGFNWHSDFETWHSEDGMPSMRAVSASVMLTDNNEFNGPLMLIPGSHKHFVPCQGRTPDNNWKTSLKSQSIGVPDQNAIKMLAERGGISAPKGGAGSLLLFDCNTLHASPQNLSPWSRANAFFVFNSLGNTLKQPYSGTVPRPEYLASRGSQVGLSQASQQRRIAI